MEFTLKLTQQEVYLLSNALGQRPYLEVVQLVNKLQVQIDEQEAAAKLKPLPGEE